MSYGSDKFFDLQKTLTTNPEFCNKVVKLQHNIQRAAEAKDRAALRHELSELLRLCDYNSSLLVPFFFPKFSGEQAMTLWSRPHAFAMMAFGADLTITVNASRQIGKCVKGDTMLSVMDDEGNREELTLEALFDRTKQQASPSAVAPC
jgi:hypothetical protein